MVRGTRVSGRDCGESSAEEGFRGAVVGRGIEGADAEVEGAPDDGVGGEGVGVGVVLVIEGCGAADEGWESC
jgi:hypothetical protein